MKPRSRGKRLGVNAVKGSGAEFRRNMEKRKKREKKTSGVWPIAEREFTV